MMEAEPMIMPSMVRRKRTLLARKLSMARRKISLKPRVELALASVRLKDEAFCDSMTAIDRD